MAVNILDVYLNKEKELKEELKIVQKWIVLERNRKIEFYTQNSNDNSLNEDIKYLNNDFGKTISGKFLNALKQEKKFLSIKQIAKAISIATGESEKNLIEKLSQVTQRLKLSGKIVNYSPNSSKKNTYWGSPRWIENDIIKKGYEFLPEVNKNFNSINEIDLDSN